MLKVKIKNSKFTASDGEQIYYAEGGIAKKKTIIFLHGLGGSGKDYYDIAKKLMLVNKVILPDYRGHGKSGKAKKFSQKRIAQDLHELIELLGLKNVMLCGHSLGAHIVFRYIREYGQDNIRSIVIIDMSPKLTNNSEWNLGYDKGRYTEDMLKLDIIDIGNDVVGFKQRVYLDFINYIRKSKKELAKPNVFHKAAAALLFPQIIIDTWKDLFSQDYRDMLGLIDVPCAIIYGNPGSIYSEGTAKYMNSQIKDSRLFAFEGIRHEGMLKQTDKVVDIVDEYTLK